MKTLVFLIVAASTLAAYAQHPCPVKVLHGRAVTENDGIADTVHITFKNVTPDAIRAIAFDVYKTDEFGDTYEPTDTVMAYEHHVAPRQIVRGEWDDVLFDELWERNDHNSKPGRFIVGVHRVAFINGRTIDPGDPDLGGCYVGF